MLSIEHEFQLYISFVIIIRYGFQLLVSFQVAALFYVGTTKSHPPIPDDLSAEAKDFLLKCLQKYVYY